MEDVVLWLRIEGLGKDSPTNRLQNSLPPWFRSPFDQISFDMVVHEVGELTITLCKRFHPGCYHAVSLVLSMAPPFVVDVHSLTSVIPINTMQPMAIDHQGNA